MSDLELVSFTGGLDSTTVMYKLMKRAADEGRVGYAHVFRPIYMNLNQGDDATFAETLLGTVIYARLADMFFGEDAPCKYYDSPLSRKPYYGMSGSSLKLCLTQQTNAVLELARIVSERYKNGFFTSVHIGWNKGDCFEQSYHIGDWSEDDYNRLLKLYSELVYFGEPGCRPSPMSTPVWDMTKKEMYDTLPSSIRCLLTSGPADQICVLVDYEAVWVLTSKCVKHKRYVSTGLTDIPFAVSIKHGCGLARLLKTKWINTAWLSHESSLLLGGVYGTGETDKKIEAKEATLECEVTSYDEETYNRLYLAKHQDFRRLGYKDFDVSKIRFCDDYTYSNSADRAMAED